MSIQKKPFHLNKEGTKCSKKYKSNNKTVGTLGLNGTKIKREKNSAHKIKEKRPRPFLEIYENLFT